MQITCNYPVVPCGQKAGYIEYCYSGDRLATVVSMWRADAATDAAFLSILTSATVDLRYVPLTPYDQGFLVQGLRVLGCRWSRPSMARRDEFVTLDLKLPSWAAR